MTKEEILAKIRRPHKPKGSLKKAYGAKDGEVAKKHPSLVRNIKKKLFANRPDKLNTQFPLLAMEGAIAEHLAGETRRYVNEKYHVNVQEALKMYFPNSAQREQVLEDVLLDNALIANVKFQNKADELSARDAALASGIFTQRFSEFKKARKADHAPDVPISTVILLQQTLERVKEVHGRVIEIENT